LEKLTCVTVGGILYGFEESGIESVLNDFLTTCSISSTDTKRNILCRAAVVAFNVEMCTFIKYRDVGATSANAMVQSLRELGFTIRQHHKN
jgi:hypothetical protein